MAVLYLYAASSLAGLGPVTLTSVDSWDGKVICRSENFITKGELAWLKRRHFNERSASDLRTFLVGWFCWMQT